MGFLSFGAWALRADVNAMLHALCAVLLLRSRLRAVTTHSGMQARITVLMGWAFSVVHVLRFTPRASR